MREYGAWNERRLMFEAINELRHIRLRIEAQTVHARVEFYMNGEIRNTLFTCCLNECFEQAEVVNLWLKVVFEQRIEGRHLGVHDDDVSRDARLSEVCALVGNGHRQVVDPSILQRLGYLNASSPVS